MISRDVIFTPCLRVQMAPKFPTLNEKILSDFVLTTKPHSEYWFGYLHTIPSSSGLPFKANHNREDVA